MEQIVCKRFGNASVLDVITQILKSFLCILDQRKVVGGDGAVRGVVRWVGERVKWVNWDSSEQQ
jgi:hypothetical protein